ncbi:MAG: hypothetical protein ABI834_08325 [Ginsengibacter sp.]
MSNYKIILAITFISNVLALSSCMEQKTLFSFEKDVNSNFLKDIPGIGPGSYFNKPVTQKANKIEIYVSSFREKFVEKNNLLEYTELNDSTKISNVPYWEVDGYSQDLYLLKYEFTFSLTNKNGKSFPVNTPAAIFFALKHNGHGDVTGIAPCYFGIINIEDNLITFDTELSLKKEKNIFVLELPERQKNNKGLLFMPADFPTDPDESSVFNIEKIVRLDANKVGGNKPLVFDITKILHDPNALQFHYISTLNLNP